MSLLPDYSSLDVNVVWLGHSFSGDGLSPSTFFTATPNGPLTESEVGSDQGDSTSILPDRSSTIVLSLQQTSYGNAFLAGCLATQAAEGRILRGDMYVADPSGSVIGKFIDVHLQADPEQALGSSATGVTRDWTFRARRLVYSSNFANLSVDITLQSKMDNELQQAISLGFKAVL